MRWTPGGESQDVEDRRDESGAEEAFNLAHAYRHWRRYPALDSQFCLKTNFFALLSGGGSVSPARPRSGNRSGS